MRAIEQLVERFDAGEVSTESLTPEIVAGILAFKALQHKKEEQIVKESRDVFFFATNCIYTKNEDSNSIEKFPPFPYFKDVVFPNFKMPGNCLWEKSRRVLMSIAACVYYFHQWLIAEFFMGGITSRSQSKVDDGGGHSTWDSLFGKMRFFYDRLAEHHPYVIEHYLGRVYDSAYLFRKLSLQNPKTNSTIIGEAPTPNCLTGGGFGIVLVDEAARVPNMVSIHSNLILAGLNVHYISYPNGPTGTFYKIRSTEGNFGFRILRIHFSMRPDRTEEWYEEQKKKMTKTEVGMLLDISYSMSAEAKVFPSFMIDGEGANVKTKLGIQIDDVRLWWDFGSVDATAVLFVQVTREERDKEFVLCVRVRDVVKLDHTNYEEVSQAVKAKLKKHGFKGKTESIPCVGDQQINQTMVDSGLTLASRYKGQGFIIHAAPHHETRSVLDQCDLMMKNGQVFVHAECVSVIDSFTGWEWPKNRDGSLKPGVTQPEHSEHSHVGKAFEYGMADLFEKKVIGTGRITRPTKGIVESQRTPVKSKKRPQAGGSGLIRRGLIRKR